MFRGLALRAPGSLLRRAVALACAAGVAALFAIGFAAPSYAQTASAPDYTSYATTAAGVEQQWFNASTGQFNTTGWWNSANALNALTDYMEATNTSTYEPDLATSFAVNKPGGFINGYYDDEGWWALNWINAYDLTGNTNYLDMAKSIFTNMTGGWGSTCGGGIWWNKAGTYKNAIANELFLTVAIRLHERTPNDSTYMNWANREWTWFKGSGMINSSNLINDGLSLPSCTNNGATTWTYNQGVILGGLTDMYRSTDNRSYLQQAELIANAAITHLVNSNGILVEPCEPNCGGDGPQFKGIFMRNLWYLYKFDNNPTYLQFIQKNVQSIWANDRNGQNQLGLMWAGPFDSADAARQSSAMDALNAAIPTGPVPDATASLSSTQVTIAPGSSGTVTLGLQNLIYKNIGTTASVSAPAGISATLSHDGAGIPANSQASLTLTVSASSDTPQNFYTVPVSVGADDVNLPTRYLTVLVAAPNSMLRLYNNTGISDDSDQLTGNFDGQGYSYSAQALASAGLTPGATVTENGTKLTWPVSKPGFPDNIQAAGQTVPVNAPSGTAQVGFLGAAAGGPSQGEVTLNYSDGSSSNFDLALSDWTLNAGKSTPSGGNVKAETLPVRNSDSGIQQSIANYLFYTGLPVNTGKTLSSVTLPISIDQGSLHIFSIGTSSQKLSGPIIDGISPSTAAAGQQVTISGSGFGATQGTSSVGFTDAGTTWGASGGPAAVTVDSWSGTSITFTVPGPSGTNNEWQVFPGSEATVSVVPASGTSSNAAILEITPSANPADYYDNIGISPDNNQACANMDGDGFSLSANALAADGVTPGGSVTGDGLTFTWPNVAACTADNILADGQTMLVQGAAGDTTLGIVGTSTNGTSSGTFVVHYTDGSISTQTVIFNDWAGGPSGSDATVSETPYRNSDSGSSQTLNMYVYVTSIPVDSSKTVESITFPQISGKVAPNVTAMHIFAVAIGS